VKACGSPPYTSLPPGGTSSKPVFVGVCKALALGSVDDGWETTYLSREVG
jgi:hypothetical protein